MQDSGIRLMTSLTDPVCHHTHHFSPLVLLLLRVLLLCVVTRKTASKLRHASLAMREARNKTNNIQQQLQSCTLLSFSQVQPVQKTTTQNAHIDRFCVKILSFYKPCRLLRDRRLRGVNRKTCLAIPRWIMPCWNRCFTRK